jgi:hypothetical protein
LLAAQTVDAKTLEFSYRSTARAIALLDRRPQKVQIDGVNASLWKAGAATLLLPRGQHLLNIVTE